MFGRPFRVNWRQEDTPEVLKAAYRADQDIILPHWRLSTSCASRYFGSCCADFSCGARSGFRCWPLGARGCAGRGR